MAVGYEGIKYHLQDQKGLPMQTIVLAGLIETVAVVAMATILYVVGRYAARFIVERDPIVSKGREHLSIIFIIEGLTALLCPILVLLIDIVLADAGLGTGSLGVTYPYLRDTFGQQGVLVLIGVLPLVLCTGAVYLSVTPWYARLRNLPPLPMYQRLARHVLKAVLMLVAVITTLGAWKAATTSLIALGLTAAVLWIVGVIVMSCHPPVTAWFRRHRYADSTVTNLLGDAADDITVYLRPDPTDDDITGRATGAATQRTITLSDSAVETLAADELAALVTHERAHHARRDPLIGAVFFVTLLVGAYVFGSVLWVHLEWGVWWSVLGITLAAVIGGWLVYLRIGSRPAEYAADRYRLDVDGNIRGREKLLKRYAENRTEGWFARLMPHVEYATSTHPTPKERLNALKAAVDSEPEIDEAKVEN